MVTLKSFHGSLVWCSILLLLGMAPEALGQSPTKILGEAKERQAGYGEMENFTILSYSDLDGWD